MARINYVVGDVREQSFKADYRFIPHVCNNEGRMGAGVAKALYTKWPEVKFQYSWHFEVREGVVELGEIIPVRIDDKTFVYNMIAQRGVMSKIVNGRAVGVDGRPPIRYAALMYAMQRIRIAAQNLSGTVEIHCPKMGCGLAGGEWNAVESMIEEIWCPLFAVTVCVIDESELPD